MYLFVLNTHLEFVSKQTNKQTETTDYPRKAKTIFRRKFSPWSPPALSQLATLCLTPPELQGSTQETPFSLYITIRKSFTKYRKDQLASSSVNHSQVDSTKEEHHHLHKKYQKQYQNLKVKHDHLLLEKKNLEDSLNTTKHDLQIVLKECEVMEEVIEELEDQKISHCEVVDSFEKKVKNLENSAESREVTNSENKIIKGEISELKDAIKVAKKFKEGKFKD
jgi:hypothetical protein